MRILIVVMVALGLFFFIAGAYRMLHHQDSGGYMGFAAILLIAPSLMATRKAK